MNLKEYHEFQARMQVKHRELLKRYLDKPFGKRDLDHDLEDELDYIERQMLDNPPLCRVANGRYRARRGGLLEGSPLIDAGKLPRVRYADPLVIGVGVIPERDWDDLIGDEDAIDIQQFSVDTLDQASNGSCACEGTAGGHMNRRVFMGLGPMKLNPLMIYGRINGGVDRGSSPEDALSFIQTHGCASQQVWPRSKGWRQEPSEEAWEDAKKYKTLEVVRPRSWKEFGSCLFFGPIGWGYVGHWIYAVKLLSRTRFVYHNSWGTNWGDGGFGTSSSSNIYWAYGAHAYRSVTHVN